MPDKTFADVQQEISGGAAPTPEPTQEEPTSTDGQTEDTVAHLPESTDGYNDNQDGTFTRLYDNIVGHFRHKEFVEGAPPSDPPVA